MTKIGFYPGSFNPWHSGHFDILEKSLLVFDKVVIAHGKNPDKVDSLRYTEWDYTRDQIYGSPLENRVDFYEFNGLLVDAIKTYPEQITAVIRGLRNGNDLQYEMNQQYWNEDLGLQIPIVYFITDRKLSHISSSAIRQIKHVQDISYS